MDDLISRQAAIDEILGLTNCRTVRELNDYTMLHKLTEMWSGGILDAIDAVIGLPSARREREAGMSDLINRQAAISAMFAEMPGLTFDGVLRVLRNLPPAQAQPERKTGEWIETKHDLYDYFICSECCAEVMDGFQYRYCPWCGARMGGKDAID